MLIIFSTPVLIRHLWQLKTVVFLHWWSNMGCPIKLIEGIALIKFENIVSCNQVSLKKKEEKKLELTEKYV